LELDDPSRGDALRQTIARKPALQDFYRDVYARYAEASPARHQAASRSSWARAPGSPRTHCPTS
jgi:hypothetical protein